MLYHSSVLLSAREAQRKRTRTRRLGFVIGIALAVVAALLLFGPWRFGPDLYDPERISVVDAERLVSEAYGRHVQQLELEKQIREAHRALQRAVLDLRKAEGIDPAHRAILDDLQARLEILADDHQTSQMDIKELQAAYSDLTKRLEHLIKALDRKRKETAPLKG